MPTAQDHRRWAQEHERFYNDIGGASSSSPPWAVTALFYVALHELRAFSLDHTITLRDHRSTKAFLRLNRGPLATLTLHYKRLYDWSITARYKGGRQFDFVKAERSLEVIRAEIVRITARNLTLTPPPRHTG